LEAGVSATEGKYLKKESKIVGSGGKTGNEGCKILGQSQRGVSVAKEGFGNA